MKGTPTTIASNSNDVSTASVRKAGDDMLTSSSQKEGIPKKSSILPKQDPPEGKTTAIVAVMRGRPKHGHHRQRSNKHYKQKLVRVLLDSDSDGDLVFIHKDKPMLLPSLKRLVPQSHGILWMGCFRLIKRLKLSWISLNIPIAKGTLQSLILLSTAGIISHSMNSFFVSKPWRSMVSF